MPAGPTRRRVRRDLLGALALGTATLLLSAVAAGDGVVPGDVAVARAVQRADGPVGTDLAAFADWLGSVPALTGVAVALALVCALARRWAGAALLLATLPLRWVNPALKDLLASPRPTPDLVRVTEAASQEGYPSGHSMGTMLLYGAVWVLAGRLEGRWVRRAVRVVAVALILVTGFGRVQTGAHWPSDVLGGYLWGATVLLVLVAGYHALRAGLRRRGMVRARLEASGTAP